MIHNVGVFAKMYGQISTKPLSEVVQCRRYPSFETNIEIVSFVFQLAPLLHIKGVEHVQSLGVVARFQPNPYSSEQKGLSTFAIDNKGIPDYKMTVTNFQVI